VLKAILAIDIVENRAEVLTSELECIWVGVEEVFKGSRAERLSVCYRFCWNRWRRIVWREGVRYTQARREGSE